MGETDTTSSLEEFGIAIFLAILAKHVSRGTWTTAVQAVVAGGAGIFVCYAIAYGIIPRWQIPARHEMILTTSLRLSDRNKVGVMRLYDVKAITRLVNDSSKFHFLNIASHGKSRSPAKCPIGFRPVPSGSVTSSDIDVYNTGKSIFCSSVDT